MSSFTNKAPKLTYFKFEAAAEKARLAFVCAGVPFEDNRIGFDEFKAIKETLPNKQLPILELENGEIVAQSMAIARYAAALGDGSLYPVRDVKKCLAIDVLIGLFDDDSRAFTPGLYMGMMPEKFGYPEGYNKTDEGGAKIKELRETYLAQDLPEYMGHLAAAIDKNGGPFLVGSTLTLADLFWLPRIRYLRKGVADHIPADCLNAYPKVLAWEEAVMKVPAIQAWYAA